MASDERQALGPRSGCSPPHQKEEGKKPQAQNNKHIIPMSAVPCSQSGKHKEQDGKQQPSRGNSIPRRRVERELRVTEALAAHRLIGLLITREQQQQQQHGRQRDSRLPGWVTGGGATPPSRWSLSPPSGCAASHLLQSLAKAPATGPPVTPPRCLHAAHLIRSLPSSTL